MLRFLSKKKRYIYVGRTSSKKVIQGELYSKHPRVALNELKSRSISPLWLKQKDKPSLICRKVFPKEITYFFHFLGSLIQQGLPIAEALKAIRLSSEPSVQRVLEPIEAKVNAGQPLSYGLDLFPEYFDKVARNLIRVAEKTGTLEEALLELSSYRERSEQIEQRLKSAKIYPFILVIGEVMLMTVMLTIIVPALKEFFEQAGASLPFLTQMVLVLSDLVIQWWWALLFGVILSLFIFQLLRTFSYKMQTFLDWLALTIPVYKQLSSAMAISRFLHGLRTQIASGLPLHEGMQAVKGTTGNIFYDRDVAKISRQLEETGHPLSKIIQNYPRFPQNLVSFFLTAEYTGEMPKMLEIASQYHDSNLEIKVEKLVQSYEMIMTLVIYASIGFVVIAMYLPIFKLGTAV